MTQEERIQQLEKKVVDLEKLVRALIKDAQTRTAKGEPLPHNIIRAIGKPINDKVTIPVVEG